MSLIYIRVSGKNVPIFLQLESIGCTNEEISFVLWWLYFNKTNPIYDEIANMIDTAPRSEILEKIGYEHDG